MLKKTGIAVVLCMMAIFLPAHASQATDHALENYLAKPDSSFRWDVRQRTRLGQSDCVELTLISQTWKEIVWKHRLFLIIPDGVKGTTDALLVIEGGRWRPGDDKPIEGTKPAYPKQAILLAGLAHQLKVPMVIVLNVPQQPVFNGKSEDAIIAHTFDQYLNTGEKDWPLLLPMVKSAVRAMDAAQTFAREDRQLNIDRFTVTGASKRGWTTWLTAAADSRVIALAPMVIDMLNLTKQLPYQFESWGEHSPRIHDYTEIKLAQRIDSPRGRELAQIVDPYAYRDQIQQPKLLLLGTNDSFWTLDALNLYWDGLTGDKYITYVPNADHDLAKDFQRVFGGIAALRQHVADGKPMPKLTWNHEAGDKGVKLTVKTGEQPQRVIYWSTQAPSRDFRKARWVPRELTVESDGSYAITIPSEAGQFNAGYVEVVYPRPNQSLSLSTTIRIVEPATP
jgi:PhoPQ-activated pathogenicity-related protein